MRIFPFVKGKSVENLNAELALSLEGTGNVGYGLHFDGRPYESSDQASAVFSAGVAGIKNTLEIAKAKKIELDQVLQTDAMALLAKVSGDEDFLSPPKGKKR